MAVLGTMPLGKTALGILEIVPCVYYWSGYDWIAPDVIKYWNGSAWVDVAEVYYWDGSTWIRVW